MQFEISFQGPCADDMIESGAIDIDDTNCDFIYIGKGETKAVAASRALGVVAESNRSNLLEPLSAAVREALPPEAWNIEADGILCNVFCVIRVTNYA